MTTARPTVALLTIVLTWAAPLAARAAADELIVAVEPGYDRLSRATTSQSGVGGTLSAWLGLTDDLWLAASGGGFQTLDEAPEHPKLFRYEAFGGLVAALDVFRVVPYLEGMAGVVGARGSVHPTIRLGLGADYLVTPELSLGAVLRYRPLPEDDLAQAAVTAQVRLGWRLEW
jgi:hypothetical protein